MPRSGEDNSNVFNCVILGDVYMLMFVRVVGTDRKQPSRDCHGTTMDVMGLCI